MRAPDHQAWLQALERHRVFAVIRAPQREVGLQMAIAMATAGLEFIEIAWNCDQAALLVTQLRHELPHCQIGVGTIMDEVALQAAIDAGAQFCFSPHVDPALIQRANQHHLPVIPGTLSPTEIVTAWYTGATCVKVFPVQAMGGPQYIRSLQGPLGQIPLIPTGGVTLENAAEFIAAGAIAVGLSTQLFPAAAVADRQWAVLTERARQLWIGLRSQPLSNPSTM